MINAIIVPSLTLARASFSTSSASRGKCTEDFLLADITSGVLAVTAGSDEVCATMLVRQPNDKPATTIDHRVSAKIRFFIRLVFSLITLSQLARWSSGENRKKDGRPLVRRPPVAAQALRPHAQNPRLARISFPHSRITGYRVSTPSGQRCFCRPFGVAYPLLVDSKRRESGPAASIL